MSEKICFLIHHSTPLASAINALYLANAALKLKHHVSLAFIDSLAYYHGDVRAEVAYINAPLGKNAAFNHMEFTHSPLSAFDTVWILSLGRRQTFLDNIQLLKLLAARVRIVNSPE